MLKIPYQEKSIPLQTNFYPWQRVTRKGHVPYVLTLCRVFPERNRCSADVSGAITWMEHTKAAGPSTRPGLMEPSVRLERQVTPCGACPLGWIQRGVRHITYYSVVQRTYSFQAESMACHWERWNLIDNPVRVWWNFFSLLRVALESNYEHIRIKEMPKHCKANTSVIVLPGLFPSMLFSFIRCHDVTLNISQPRFLLSWFWF